MHATLRLLILAGLAVSVCAACVSTAPELQLPERFLPLETFEAGDFKAITPDEARVWVRVFPESGGDVKYWGEALKLNLVDGRGYVLLEERTVTTASGKQAVELLCETRVTGQPTKYLITLLVRPAPAMGEGEVEIVVVEYSAPKEKFDTYLDDVRGAVAKL